MRSESHFESDHGAAIKVKMRKGQTVTVVNPDFEAWKRCGFCWGNRWNAVSAGLPNAN